MGNNNVIDKCMQEGIKVPKMLEALINSGEHTFYKNDPDEWATVVHKKYPLF